MSKTTVATGGIADDAVGNTKLDLTANYAFTGTISGLGLNLLSSITISDGDSVAEVPNVLSSTYKTFLMIGTGIEIDTDDNHIRFQVSTDNGSSFVSSSIYDTQGTGYNAGSATTPINQTNSAYGVIAGYGNLGSEAGESTSFELWMANPLDTTVNKMLWGHQVSQRTNGTLLDADVGMMIEQTAAYNAFRIYPSGGNFDAGTLKIYGAL